MKKNRVKKNLRSRKIRRIYFIFIKYDYKGVVTLLITFISSPLEKCNQALHILTLKKNCPKREILRK